MQWLELDNVCGARSDMAQMKEEQTEGDGALIIPPDGWSCGGLCTPHVFIAADSGEGRAAASFEMTEESERTLLLAYGSHTTRETEAPGGANRRESGSSGGSGDKKRPLGSNRGESQKPKGENLERISIKLKGKWTPPGTG